MNSILSGIKSQFSYIQQFVMSPRTFGTIAPSSPWLCQSMLNQVDWNNNHSSPWVIAELGAASGVLTKRLLVHMNPDDNLFAYEIQTNFINQLNKINDSRLQIMPYSAELLDKDCDVVFSCLPLLSLPVKVCIRILKQTQLSLQKKKGSLILFQYTNKSERLLSRYFEWERIRVMRNIPPAYVYVCHPRK